MSTNSDFKVWANSGDSLCRIYFWGGLRCNAIGGVGGWGIGSGGLRYGGVGGIGGWGDDGGVRW